MSLGTLPPKKVELNYEILWADSDALLTRVVAALNRAADRGEVAGLDTEFYGMDLRTQSTPARAKLHLVSVACPRFPAEVSPRGYPVADAAVAGKRALDHTGFRDWLARDCAKAVHNLPVDAHTVGNHGLVLNGGVNTLATARWTWPGRARDYSGGAPLGFTLDALARDYLGVGKTEEFKELFSEPVVEYRVRTKRVRVCSCGAPAVVGHPRQINRSDLLWEQRHVKHWEVQETREPYTVIRPIPLESVGPDHPLWPRVLRYSAQDAWLALAIYHLAMRQLERRKVEVPWLV